MRSVCNVRKLALVDRLRLRLLGFDYRLSFLGLLRLIEFDLWRVGVEFLAGLRSIILVIAEDLEEILQDHLQDRDRYQVDRPAFDTDLFDKVWCGTGM
jgi:hypothetical protein